MHNFSFGAGVLLTYLPKPARIVLGGLLILGGTWIFLRFLLPFLLPLVLAAGLAALCEGPVRLLERRVRIPRAAGAGVCVIAVLGLLSAGLWALLSRVFAETRELIARLPELIAQVSLTLDGLYEHLTAFFGGASWLDGARRGFTELLSALPGRLSSFALSAVSSLAAGAPGALLFAVTAVIGAYFISASLPGIRAFLALQLPDGARERCVRIKNGLRSTLWRWLRAQLIMTAIVFACLTLAFWLLRLDYALLLSVVTALIDALPVLGAGTVLIPWAAYELLAGSAGLGLGLLVTYGAVTVLRSCIQAKLLGDQLGLHPLVTLAAIYIGWRACGVWGMIVFPVIAISVSQLNDSGLVHLWKTPEKNGGESSGRSHIQYNSGRGDEHPGRDEHAAR